MVEAFDSYGLEVISLTTVDTAVLVIYVLLVMLSTDPSHTALVYTVALGDSRDVVGYALRKIGIIFYKMCTWCCCTLLCSACMVVLVHAIHLLSCFRGLCNIGYPPNLIWGLNLVKNHLSMTSTSIVLSFWNFVQSTAVLCPKFQNDWTSVKEV